MESKMKCWCFCWTFHLANLGSVSSDQGKSRQISALKDRAATGNLDVLFSPQIVPSWGGCGTTLCARLVIETCYSLEAFGTLVLWYICEKVLWLPQNKEDIGCKTTYWKSDSMLLFHVYLVMFSLGITTSTFDETVRGVQKQEAISIERWSQGMWLGDLPFKLERLLYNNFPYGFFTQPWIIRWGHEMRKFPCSWFQNISVKAVFWKKGNWTQ